MKRAYELARNYMVLLYYLVRPKTIILRRFSRGLGDNIMLSMLVPSLRAQYPRHKIIVETPWPTLFHGNPHIDWVTDLHVKTTRRHLRPRYRVDPSTKVSIYRQLAQSIGVPWVGAPEVFLSDREIESVRHGFPESYVAICPSGKMGLTANRKEWGVDRFQRLCELLEGISIVQIGAPSDPLLKGVIDARGLEIRKTAAVLKCARIFIGLEGGLMHLSKSVGVHAAIVYGGFILPEISAHEDQLVLCYSAQCSPCFDSNKRLPLCHTMECMDAITPRHVFEAIDARGWLS
jgi:ADP-heptose:LPS heptosyltransferase